MGARDMWVVELCVVSFRGRKRDKVGVGSGIRRAVQLPDLSSDDIARWWLRGVSCEAAKDYPVEPSRAEPSLRHRTKANLGYWHDRVRIRAFLRSRD